VKRKPSQVPVFLIYAGIIHALGLALLMPMLITLPAPGSLVESQPAAIDVEIVPGSPAAATTEADREQTSALPSAGPEAEAKGDGDAVANVSPDAAAVEQGPVGAESPASEEAKPKDATPAKAAPLAAKKPVVKRSRTVRSPAKRPAKAATKIAPFNGALSGLFSPGAPAKRR